MNSDETIDTRALAHLVDFEIKAGVHGLWNAGNRIVVGESDHVQAAGPGAGHHLGRVDDEAGRVVADALEEQRLRVVDIRCVELTAKLAHRHRSLLSRDDLVVPDLFLLRLERAAQPEELPNR